MCATDNIDTKVFFVFGITGSGKGQFNYIMDWYKQNVKTGLLKEGTTDNDTEKYNLGYYFNNIITRTINKDDGGKFEEMEAPTPLNLDLPEDL